MDRIVKHLFALYRKASLMSPQEAAHLLGVPLEASEEEIKSAYRQKAREFHPDLAGPEGTQMMQRINEARLVLTTKTTVPPPNWSGSSQVWNESFWDTFREKYGPKPSGHYGPDDLERLVQFAFENKLVAMNVRHPRDSVPLTDGFSKGSYWSYMGPFGSSGKVYSIEGKTVPDLVRELVQLGHGGMIFDLAMKSRLAWVTWKQTSPRTRFQSISFELPKVKKVRPPGAGMNVLQIDSAFRQNGFTTVAGGTKLTYWGPPGSEKLGVLIRQSTRTLRVVSRLRQDTGIADVGLTKEFYFGDLTPELIGKLVDYVKKRR